MRISFLKFERMKRIFLMFGPKLHKISIIKLGLMMTILFFKFGPITTLDLLSWPFTIIFFKFGPMTTRDLLSWSFQIAKGMEYLASKKVIKNFK